MRSAFLRFLSLLCLFIANHAMALDLQRSSAQCVTPYASALRPPAAAGKRLADSQIAEGQRDIAWAWLVSPTHRYPHKSLGSTEHAGAVHVQARLPDGRLQDLTYKLPLHRVFEDLVPRLVDLDGDGRDELVLVESDLLRGSSVVVLGLRSAQQLQGVPSAATAAGIAGVAGITGVAHAAGVGKAVPMVLTELARSPFTGSSFLWLNPLGFADFDGDGRTDVAAVITPHIGGTLTLYHYRPPLLVPFAKAMDVSNHRMGAVEQQLGVVLPPVAPGQRASIVVPDMTRRALHWLQWSPRGEANQWSEMSDLMALPAKVERMLSTPDGACLYMADGSWWKLVLAH